MLSNAEAKLLLEKVCPLGQVPKYDPNTETIKLVETSTRRFINDGWHVHRAPKSIVLSAPDKLDVNNLGFGMTEALALLMQDDYQLYVKLFNFFETVDRYASTVISETSNSVVVISHKSFGERLFPHIHQDSGQNLPTLSLFFNLTNSSNESPVLELYDEVEHNSKFFKKGYTDHKLLLLHERKNQQVDKINISNNVGVLFNAYNTPHTFSYTDDIWVTVLYDNVLPIEKFNYEGRYSVFPIQL
jgi:hypothetical protein